MSSLCRGVPATKCQQHFGLLEIFVVDMDNARVLLLFVKLNIIFRAGCDSLPAVIWKKPLARERKLTWCDPGADSKVWMREDAKMRI